jgi:hypothetical protein
MASVCLEFPYGAVRHFPAGNYYKQMKTMTGVTEFELMNLVHSVWYAFKYLSLGEWKEEQARLMGWLMAKPEPPPPTRRIDAIIALIWGASDWATGVLENMRNGNAYPH